MLSKISVFAVVFFVLLAVGTVLFSGHNTEQILQQEWEALLQSPDSAAELRHIKALTEIVNEQNGYWSAFAIDSGGRSVNITNTPDEIRPSQTVKLVFRWGDRSFTGKNWKPLATENIYAFFAED